MDYPGQLAAILKPRRSSGLLAVDLFAGCGGLALGFEAAGIETIGFEIDADACETYRKNLRGECHQVVLTPSTSLPACDILIGGPPCQPFSVGGLQLGLQDSRDGFPAFISAVKRLRPKLFLFENVRGMLYANRCYFDEIVAALAKLGYAISYKLLNAEEYGVPQRRERLIVVGHETHFTFPLSVGDPVTAGDALLSLAVSTPPESKFLTASMDRYVANYEKASKCIRPRDLHLDRPARTLTCRNLAGATGDMQRVRLPDGRRRRLLIREAARLQSFPDWFDFVGGETSRYNQIGNAVPPLFAWHLAKAVLRQLGTRQLAEPRVVKVRTQRLIQSELAV
ncbi:MAG: DNA cytosine methyltransferase [Prosthecobacter sp.]|jgi:DNA (cytosine-5)-methyltransferase 1|uniref:DNA cytosine methyltransferase n=1 Tax=Prosthecobacter sp. TaxID=1965333 RepID=UPI0019F18E7B|nr:DNA cytosine methyltransferase [Prosthecobacter sp.]MBE2284443.1 DNA cytosine methyltransferase [Prosthecobacter sp.]